jgi:1,4-alpha-glucan branching enzyme
MRAFFTEEQTGIMHIGRKVVSVLKRLLLKIISFVKREVIMGKRRKNTGLENKTTSLKKVLFTLSAPEAQNVSLLGDFNGWEAHPHSLKKDKKGDWKISINLTPGKYEYRFLVDGEWQNDPTCASFVHNTFGSENCLLTLEDD